jgi:hypothetical protein
MNTTHSHDLGWAIRLPRAAAAEIQSLRLFPGIEVGEEGDSLWLRGADASDVLELRLKTLPSTVRYVCLPEDRLREKNSRLASATLPALAWKPLLTWAKVVLPPARLPAGLPSRSQLRLVASLKAGCSNALSLTFDEWFGWVMNAPLVRLTPLVYATRPDGLTLVLGLPLPSAQGRYLVEREGVILPAGYACSPDVTLPVIRRVFGAAEHELVYWDEAGARLLNRDLFVPASRASLRATRLALSVALSDAD